MNRHILELGFFAIILAGVILLTIFIFEPFWSALALGAVFAIVLYPVYEFILKDVQKRRNLAAFLTVLAFVFVVFLPLIFFGSLIFKEVTELAQSDTTTFLGEKVFDFKNYVEGVLPVEVDVQGFTENTLGKVASNLGSFFTGFMQVILGLFIMLIALFFFFRDAETIKKQILYLSPLADKYDEQLIEKVKVAINSVVRGALIIAIIQGILTGFGFLVVGISNPALWGGVATIASLIPLLGTPVVILPAVGFLFFTGKIVAGIGLLLWGILVVGLVDNYLRPKLIGRDVKIHPLLILLSVLGGIGFMGSIGFIMGPVILALLFALLEIMPEVVKAR